MTTIHDLGGIDVEHLISDRTLGPLVLVRCIATSGERTIAVTIGQITPEDARQIAAHLVECAARAEYEHDLLAGAQSKGFPLDHALHLCQLVRIGEAARHEGGN